LRGWFAGGAVLVLMAACGTDVALDPHPASVDSSFNRIVGVLQAKLVASDGAGDDRFGGSVSVSGDTAIVGAFADDVGMTARQGSAYVFVRNGATWTEQAKLVANDGMTDATFGLSVSISGDTVLVGAFRDNVGANVGQGSAYVFVRNGTTWTQQAKLVARDGAANDLFGHSVALSGDTALIGAVDDDLGANQNQGSAYVFVRHGTTWTQQAKLVADDGSANDLFGISVSVTGDTVLVGAPFKDVGPHVAQGSAYVFTRNGITWTQQAQLVANDGAANESFGESVSLSGDTALVGSLYDDVGTNVGQGSAYVFARNGTTWAQQAKLVASDGAGNDLFGSSVSISGDTVLVGALAADVGANVDQGSVYVFTRNKTTWTQQTKLVVNDGAASDLIGYYRSVSVSGDTVLVGNSQHDVVANADQGSAYVFVLRKANGDARVTEIARGAGLVGK